MNKLSMINIQNKTRPEAFCSELIIDGITINEWFAKFIDKNTQLSDVDISDLGLSLNLDFYPDTKLVWYYLGQLNNGSVNYVPLLVCPDDNDLSCTVIVTEQCIIDDKVIWRRFGLLEGFIQEQNPNTIDWFDAIPKLIFSIDNFEKIFGQFKRDFTEAYKHQGEFIDIDFPTNFIN